MEEIIPSKSWNWDNSKTVKKTKVNMATKGINLIDALVSPRLIT